MGYSGIIILVAIFIMITVHIVQIFTDNRETNIANDIFSAGLTLILSSVPSFNDTLVALIAGYLNIKLTEVRSSNVLLGLGIILLITGIVYRENIKEKVYVLNMLGIYKREISEKNAIKELKIADYKLKEQVIDFMAVFNEGKTMDKRANDYIVKQIKEDSIKFVDRTKDYVSCFTGMAPIPYTVLAGTFLGNAKINRYFEFNRHIGDKYYELKKANYFQKKKGWIELKEEYPDNINLNSTDIVLAISISHEVNQNDLHQFNGWNIVNLKLDEKRDNIIEYYEQLLDYKNAINNCLDINLRNHYPGLKNIHIVASIPSCVSIEMGKSIGMGTNRVNNIIVYHYILSNTPKYTFGVTVSGQYKCKFIKCN